MAALKLSRRTFLLGAGGVAIGLPILEAMLDSHGTRHADGSPLPLRYLLCFGGQSLGAGDNEAGGDPSPTMYVPDRLGRDYDLKLALAPLSEHGNVKEQISVVSGLRMPYADKGQPLPPGGWGNLFHNNAHVPLLTGMRSDAMRVTGPSSDQIVAAQLGRGMRFASLNYRVQAANYVPFGPGEAEQRARMTYQVDGSGQVVPVEPTASPKLAYETLFTGFAAQSPEEASRRAYLLRQRKSAVDLVLAHGNRLVARLGRSDQQRVSRHLDELRDLERRLNAADVTPHGRCTYLPHPGDDPPIGGELADEKDASYRINHAWSDEETRARVFCDLLHMAFTCDLARVATLMFTTFQSSLNAFPICGYKQNVHVLSHLLDTLAVSKAIAWHMKHFGYLVAKLRDTPEGGGNLLDRMAIAFLHEGGHGYTPEFGGLKNQSHSTENMACLIAGGAGNLKTGQHIRAEGRHPANVLLTLMHAVGVPAGSLGEVAGVIPELVT